MKILHTMIRVKDIEKSLKFYQDFIGLELKKKKRLDDCWLYFLTDKQGTCEIELTLNDEIPDNGYDIGSGFGHLAFEVDSFDEVKKLMKTYNYKYLYEPYQISQVSSTVAFLKDPDGYEIELIKKNK